MDTDNHGNQSAVTAGGPAENFTEEEMGRQRGGLPSSTRLLSSVCFSRGGSLSNRLGGGDNTKIDSALLLKQ